MYRYHQDLGEPEFPYVSSRGGAISMKGLPTGGYVSLNLLGRRAYQPKNSVLKWWAIRYILARLCFALPGPLAGQRGIEAPDRERCNRGKGQGRIGEIPG